MNPIQANIEIVERAFREALKPDPVFTVSEWADRHRILSRRASSEAGKWRTKRTPYLKAIMDALSITNSAKKVVFKKASQIGGTEAGNNWIGYIIDHVPGPTMLVLPTVDTAKRSSHLRIEPLIDECPTVKEKVATARSRDASHTVLQKDFVGGTLVIAGANSAAGLKSVPCRFVMLDELDEYPDDVEGQGSPVSLVLARSRTFSRRKAFLVSTPTTQGLSKIDQEYLDSDQREYFVPCPHCRNKQPLEFEKLTWTPGDPASAQYTCSCCGALIEERHKTKMLEQGEWRAQNPGHETVGFFLNSLYSPIGWFSWSDIARDYEEAKRDFEKTRSPRKLITFTNTVLGMSWSEPGEVPDWKRVYLQRKARKVGVVPNGVGFLTAGVDVQKDRLEVEVVGWGIGKTSWSIDYAIFSGDTGQDDVWNQLKEYIGRMFVKEGSEFTLPIKCVAIDSGYNTQQVYSFSRGFHGNQVVAVKGSDTLAQPVGHPKIVDVKMRGKPTVRRGAKVWTIGVSVLKGELYGWLKLDPPMEGQSLPPGYCNFPEYDEEFFQQLTAEKEVIRRNRRGFAVREWVKDRERNEVLDCRVYARAAASLVGIDRMKEQDWLKFGVSKTVVKSTDTSNHEHETDKPGEQTAQEPTRSPAPVRKVTVTRRRSSFW